MLSVHLRRLSVAVTAALTIGAGALGVGACADDDDDEATAEDFCARLSTTATATGVGLGGTIGTTELTDVLVVFQQLQEDAPPAIDEDVDAIVDQLGDLIDALDDVDGQGTGVEALQAAAELADVDLTEIDGAAARVAEYAADECDVVDEAELPAAG